MFIHLSNFSARQNKFHPGNPLEIVIEDKRSYARLFLCLLYTSDAADE